MTCYHCGQEIDRDNENCPFCGAFMGAGATVVLDQIVNPYAMEPESGRTDPLVNDRESCGYGYRGYSTDCLHRPVIQFAADRSLLKMVLLGLVTFGIYDLVIWNRMVTELNIAASRHDGQRTMPFFAMVTLAPFTLGIYSFIWYHKLCNRIGAELARRGFEDKFNASAFWIWNVLGSLILIGPFVFIHKLTGAMNRINDDFNVNG